MMGRVESLKGEAGRGYYSIWTHTKLGGKTRSRSENMNKLHCMKFSELIIFFKEVRINGIYLDYWKWSLGKTNIVLLGP